MSTLVPIGPLEGVKELIVGPGDSQVTVNEDELVAVPFGVLTEIAPVVASFGTEVVMLVGELTVKPTGTPLNATLEAARKSLPVIVTLDPAGPLVGVNELIVGGLVSPGSS